MIYRLQGLDVNEYCDASNISGGGSPETASARTGLSIRAAQQVKTPALADGSRCMQNSQR
jgi:hypothetical protein